MTKEDFDRKFVELALTTGVALQKGQLLLIVHQIAHTEIVEKIRIAALAMGASEVVFDFIDWDADLKRAANSTEEELKILDPGADELSRRLVQEKGARLYICGESYPHIFDRADEKKVSIIRQTWRASRRFYYEHGSSTRNCSWCMIPYPSLGWAKQVYPDLRGDLALERMYQDLSRMLKLDSPDPVTAWAEQDAKLTDRSDKLNRLGIDRLRFIGPATDLTIGLTERSIFGGAGIDTTSGHHHLLNLPTYEVWTTPHRLRVDGHVAVTCALAIGGVLVEDLRIKFESGRVVDFSASGGAQAFKQLLSADKGAGLLGEVALVGSDSVVGEMKSLFRLTLLDENARCHIAFGSAYRDRIAGSDGMTNAELDEIGMNTSVIHDDVMISNEETVVYAILRDGSEVPILRFGEWQI